MLNLRAYQSGQESPALKVAKFGGSSLSDAGQFKKVRDIVLSDPARRYIVPSAPGKRHALDHKVTDLLYLCHAMAMESREYDEVFLEIVRRYRGIIDELKVDINLTPHFTEIRERLESGCSADYMASRGEFLNGLLLAKYLNFDFIDADNIVFFDDTGKFDSEATQAAASRVLAAHYHVVVPGFYGVCPDGEIKTFSRGGSDISGAIIARAVGADIYENWTDVSGFLMADPRIVENPRPIDVLTYRELRELSYMGATVLHEDAIFPVRQAGIPIHIRNTNRPEDPGTLIVPKLSELQKSGDITGIAGHKGFTVLSVEKAMMNAELGFGRRVLAVIEQNGISFEHLPTGIDTLSVVISDRQLDGKLKTVISGIEAACSPDSIEVTRNMALVATVGTGMVQKTGMAAKLFAALAKRDINVRMIDQGSSEMNIIVGVENEDFEKAVRAVYEDLA